MPGVDAVSVLEELRRVGKPATAVIYRRHGAHDETWGVTYADLKRIAKSLRGRSALAEPLWASGIHDARVLATSRQTSCRTSSGHLPGRGESHPLARNRLRSRGHFRTRIQCLMPGLRHRPTGGRFPWRWFPRPAGA
ncbi:MAG: hypothetical protein EB033_12655 [Proteobacteria bacterium]|nr:hypothetical protein [Pseudomonadota bacterium]